MAGQQKHPRRDADEQQGVKPGDVLPGQHPNQLPGRLAKSPGNDKPAPKNNSPKEAGSARLSSCANKPKPTADMATGR